MANFLDLDSFQEIIEAFKKIDQNNDGIISEKDIQYSNSSHLLANDENELKYPDKFLKLLNLNETDSNSPVSITTVDFFIFLIRNMVDYKNESITDILFMNLLKNNNNNNNSNNDNEDNESSCCYLKANNLKTMMKKANIEFNEDDLASMINYAEFDNDGKIDKTKFNKLMQKLSSFNKQQQQQTDTV